MTRLILILLAFYLLYRVIQGIVRALTGGPRQRVSRSAGATDQQAQREPPEYHDVRDATFKDIPSDKSKKP
jgi:hypothetical protein